uniref:UMP-CMP kinase Deoxycytidylate kinase Uridine monophosphate/cytidine monophosphate kinase n=1 Tax=Rhizophora mucronata TaxID=61149 RepID=A0A2P2J345_RHIMU
MSVTEVLDYICALGTLSTARATQHKNNSGLLLSHSSVLLLEKERERVRREMTLACLPATESAFEEGIS